VRFPTRVEIANAFGSKLEAVLESHLVAESLVSLGRRG